VGGQSHRLTSGGTQSDRGGHGGQRGQVDRDGVPVIDPGDDRRAEIILSVPDFILLTNSQDAGRVDRGRVSQVIVEDDNVGTARFVLVGADEDIEAAQPGDEGAVSIVAGKLLPVKQAEALILNRED